MKILRLLNKKYFSIILILFLSINVYAEDKPVDIWNIEEKEKIENLSNKSITNEVSESKTESDIFSMYSKKKDDTIKLDQPDLSEKINIYGLYDPEDYDLDIDMWSNSNGNQLKKILVRIHKLNLSDDAKEIMKIALLTNAHPPKIDISEAEFLKLRSKWLIKNSDLDLIEEYLIKNQIIDLQPKLTKYLIDQYLSDTKINKACNVFLKNLKPIKDDYLSKFNIYCLIKSGKKDEAQLIFDLKKELGFRDKYFER